MNVEARNIGTGTKEEVKANAQGFYAFSSLDVGEYEIVMQQAGFTTYRRTGILVNVGSALEVDATLQLGTHQQSVTVSESTARLETSSTQLGQVITGKQIKALPLNGRSYTDLFSLQPGVAPQSTIQPNSVVMTGVNTSIAPSGGLNPGTISISGMREFANGFILNGSNVEEHVNMGTAIVPNLDSIAEFRILTSNFDVSTATTPAARSLLPPNQVPISSTATSSSFCVIRVWTRAFSSLRSAPNTYRINSALRSAVQSNATRSSSSWIIRALAE